MEEINVQIKLLYRIPNLVKQQIVMDVITTLGFAGINPKISLISSDAQVIASQILVYHLCEASKNVLQAHSTSFGIDISSQSSIVNISAPTVAIHTRFFDPFVSLLQWLSLISTDVLMFDIK